jgi:hypothetical protein
MITNDQFMGSNQKKGEYSVPRIECRQILLEEVIAGSVEPELFGTDGGVTQSDWMGYTTQSERDGDVFIDPY